MEEYCIACRSVLGVIDETHGALWEGVDLDTRDRVYVCPVTKALVEYGLDVKDRDAVQIAAREMYGDPSQCCNFDRPPRVHRPKRRSVFGSASTASAVASAPADVTPRPNPRSYAAVAIAPPPPPPPPPLSVAATPQPESATPKEEPLRVASYKKDPLVLGPAAPPTIRHQRSESQSTDGSESTSTDGKEEESGDDEDEEGTMRFRLICTDAKTRGHLQYWYSKHRQAREALEDFLRGVHPPSTEAVRTYDWDTGRVCSKNLAKWTAERHGGPFFVLELPYPMFHGLPEGTPPSFVHAVVVHARVRHERIGAKDGYKPYVQAIQDTIDDGLRDDYSFVTS